MLEQEKPLLRVQTILENCVACPSSWSGKLVDGRNWRVRYRWGELRLTVDKDPNRMSVFSMEAPEYFYSEQIGDNFDGYMEYERMKEILQNHLDLTDVEWV